MRANTARHYEASPEKSKARVKRRSELEALAEGSYAQSDLNVIRSKLDDRCYYCDSELAGGGEIEHILPIARGGTNYPQNITLACFKCNRAKREKTAEEFYTWRTLRGLFIRKH